MTTVILLAIAAAAAWAASLYLWPHRNCPRCHGARGTASRSGRRTRLCTRCSGTGRTRRPGATAVHRFYWSVIGDHARQRRRAAIERLRASYQDLTADFRDPSDSRQAPDDPRTRQHPGPPDL